MVVRLFSKMMIGKSIPEYIFIKTAIAALRLIAPCSVLCVAWMLLVPAPAQLDPKWALLYSRSLIYASLEAAFFVCVYLPRRYHLQKACTIFLVVVRSADVPFRHSLGCESPQAVPQRTQSTLPEML